MDLRRLVGCPGRVFLELLDPVRPRAFEGHTVVSRRFDDIADLATGILVQAGCTYLPLTRAWPCHCLPGRPTATA